VWNSLPPSVPRLSKSSFSKGCTMSILFDALSSSDDYIDLTIQIMQTVYLFIYLFIYLFNSPCTYYGGRESATAFANYGGPE
jgi:hypothetical protein